jgi:hypothetical protein
MSTSTEKRGGTIPHAMQMHQPAVMQAAGPDKSLNAGLSGCTAIPSISSPTLPLLTINYRIKVRLDLQVDKSSVVVNGPFFP